LLFNRLLGVSVMKRFIKPTAWVIAGALVLALVGVAARRRGGAGTAVTPGHEAIMRSVVVLATGRA